jgi:hypothetical protein
MGLACFLTGFGANYMLRPRECNKVAKLRAIYKKRRSDLVFVPGFQARDNCGFDPIAIHASFYWTTAPHYEKFPAELIRSEHLVEYGNRDPRIMTQLTDEAIAWIQHS